MKAAPWLVAGGIVASSFAAVSAPQHVQASTPPAMQAPVQNPAPPAAQDTAAFSSNDRDAAVGHSVYLRSTKTFIGKIVAVDAKHHFPPSFPHSAMKAVRLQHNAGPLDWVPLEGFMTIYVVSR